MALDILSGNPFFGEGSAPSFESSATAVSRAQSSVNNSFSTGAFSVGGSAGAGAIGADMLQNPIILIGGAILLFALIKKRKK